MISDDSRNVTDEFKGLSESAIRQVLDARGVATEIAVENTIRDYNLGTIIRSANAFGIRTVHIIGRRQWNKRGAMMTDKYLCVKYHDSAEHLRAYSDERGYKLVAIDNVNGATIITQYDKRPETILWFGQEGPGLSDEALALCDDVVMVAQRGSTRSLNVGVAAGIVMHEWTNI